MFERARHRFVVASRNSNASSPLAASNAADASVSFALPAAPDDARPASTTISTVILMIRIPSPFICRDERNLRGSTMATTD
jgi:hypothetical protein